MEEIFVSPEPGFMALNIDGMEDMLDSFDWTPRDFATALDIYIEEAYQLLGGWKVKYALSRRFIQYYTAGLAAGYMDWPAMGMENPMEEIGNQIIQEESLRIKKWREKKRLENLNGDTGAVEFETLLAAN